MWEPDEKVRDPNGRLQFFVRSTGNRELVCDKVGRQLGFCDEHNTFEPSGKKLALDPQPALLFKGEGERKP